MFDHHDDKQPEMFTANEMGHARDDGFWAGVLVALIASFLVGLAISVYVYGASPL